MRIWLFAAIFAALALGRPSAAAEDLSEDEMPMSSRVPMYGHPNVARSAPQKAADEELIRGFLEAYNGDRRAASNQAWFLGEEFLAEAKPNHAMSRYNHSWLIDSLNYRAFWGFGRVLLRWNDLDGAVRHLEEARRLCGDSISSVEVLAAVGTAYSRKAASLPTGKAEERARYFSLADRQFAECLRRDPEYSNGWLLWAQALLREGKFAEAWQKTDAARRLRADVSESFLKELRAGMPEPKRRTP